MTELEIKQAIDNFRLIKTETKIQDLKQLIDPNHLIFCTVPLNIYEKDPEFFDNSIDLFLQKRVFNARLSPIAKFVDNDKEYFCLVSFDILAEDKRYYELFKEKIYDK